METPPLSLKKKEIVKIRKNNTVLWTEPTVVNMDITSDALCRHKSVGALLRVFNGGCSSNGTINVSWVCGSKSTNQKPLQHGRFNCPSAAKN